ncbi:unnamed protein product, partial [Rotaria sordida]
QIPETDKTEKSIAPFGVTGLLIAMGGAALSTIGGATVGAGVGAAFGSIGAEFCGAGKGAIMAGTNGMHSVAATGFQDAAKIYDQARPSYTNEAIQFIKSLCPTPTTIVDLGAGTAEQKVYQATICKKYEKEKIHACDFSLDQLLTTINNENKESIILISFDPNIGSSEDTEKTKQTLRLRSKPSEILSRLSSVRQIDSIFIFCVRKTRYEYLLNDFKKMIGIYINLDDLSKSIKEQIDLVDRQIQTFSFFDQHQKSTKHLSHESAEFLWFQLFIYVIARLPRNRQAKQQIK